MRGLRPKDQIHKKDLCRAVGVFGLPTADWG